MGHGACGVGHVAWAWSIRREELTQGRARRSQRKTV